MSKLGTLIGYIPTLCPNCGKVRVEAWSSWKHVCEKCRWCLEDNDYYFEEDEEFDRYIDAWNACQPGYLLSREEIQKLMVAHGSRNLHNPL